MVDKLIGARSLKSRTSKKAPKQVCPKCGRALHPAVDLEDHQNGSWCQRQQLQAKLEARGYTPVYGEVPKLDTAGVVEVWRTGIDRVKGDAEVLLARTAQSWAPNWFALVAGIFARRSDNPHRRRRMERVLERMALDQEYRDIVTSIAMLSKNPSQFYQLARRAGLFDIDSRSSLFCTSLTTHNINGG